MAPKKSPAPHDRGGGHPGASFNPTMEVLMRRITIRTHATAVLLAAAAMSAACDTSVPTDATTRDMAASKTPGAGYRYTILNYPGANWTQALRMNARGDVVGIYQDATGMNGFLLRGKKYETLQYPGAAMTHARGINERGDIVGDYIHSGKTHGFVVRNGVFTTLAVPGANATQLWDINANGEISGQYQATAGGAWHGFVWRKGEFRFLNIPDATMSAGYGINIHGQVVGHYRLPDPSAPSGVTKMFGFVWTDGEVTHLDYPSPNYMSCAQGIGNHGVVGHFWDIASDIVYGYVWQAGTFTSTFRVPDAWDTYPTSITPSGTIVGYHLGADWTIRGFIAEPLNPAGR
jgi:uncharacterized membrane protein